MKFAFLSFFIFAVIHISAQQNSLLKEEFEISGTVKENGNNNPIGFANVSIVNIDTDKFISGTTTDIDGKFQLKTNNENIYISISFIGFEKLDIKELNWTNSNVLLGDVFLNEEGELIENIIVTAEKSSTEFKTDRRIFNVGSELTNSGASALEVLNNVPSVNVDIEGAVTLRGSSGVQILINGKPSVLADDESGALGNITADMIEKVEVITNPSAKYEAEGTAGIINIILKKNDKKALNGSITLNTGLPHTHSLGFSLNKRTEKFNLFTQAGIGYRERENDVINNTSNFLSDVSLTSEGTQARNEQFYNIILGTDYYINPRNIITLSGNYTFEKEDQPSFTTFNFSGDEGLASTWTRSESTQAANPKFQYDLQYKKEFKDNKDHQLIFSAIGNSFSKDQSSVFTEELLIGDEALSDQLTRTNFKETKYTYNLDYTNPFTDRWTVETGVQYVDNIVSNDYQVEDFDGLEYVVNEGLTNVFIYDQKVFGAYVTGAYEYGLWGLKGGARAEYTDLTTFLENTNELNPQTFWNFFPSAHASYKINDRISLQASYSSRIYRPRLWNLNPFFNIRNDFSIRVGNPELMPEYTDSYELGSVFIFDKITFNLAAYQRFTTNKIEYVSQFEDNVRIYSPLNLGTSDIKGIELNFKYSPIKKITINGDLNYNYFTREGTFDDQEFDFNYDQWSTKLTSKYKISKVLEIEATGRYNSEVQTVQGIQSANIFMDFGARYKIMKGKIIASLSVRDVFSSRYRESFVFEENFENYSFSQLGRVVSVGVSYGFGKGEAMTYGGGRRR